MHSGALITGGAVMGGAGAYVCKHRRGGSGLAANDEERTSARLTRGTAFIKRR